MNNKEQEELYYIEAKKRVSQLKWFYIHLAAYLVVVTFVIWNLFIIEDTPYTNAILAVNYTTVIVWGFFVVLNAIKVFKGRSLFNKKWEEKKIKEFMGENHKTWE
ncbi:2TM domain-containing protein [Winogradskyella wandonensis]|uniref:2TM domain-containing protein n=1 Tax=Winogradskyella wandonensis TaxID=1442586 RepID=A0A4R1KUK0_9FLAO|nr:2TM domain-containing protein [Winogradskyella wandonensis]TCK68862.1 2TM domain-containing protein [Winogradskyella wandonensis]